MLQKGQCPVCGRKDLVGNSFYYDFPVCYSCNEDAQEADDVEFSKGVKRMYTKAFYKERNISYRRK
jgi:hypothetical protein